MFIINIHKVWGALSMRNRDRILNIGIQKVNYYHIAISTTFSK